jgi:cell division protein FtsA
MYVNVGTPQIHTQHSKGIVAVSRADSEIYQDDIDRAVKASQAINLAPNRMIVHNVTREYIVDGVGDIIDPLGLSGNRLEVTGLIIDAFAPHVKAILRVLELSGGKLGGLVLGPIAVSRSVLSKSQRDLGVVVIDVGGGTTSVSIYEESKLVQVAVFPVGAGNITNDLAIYFKIPVAAAENLKLNYGYAYSKDIGVKETVDMKKFSEDHSGNVSRRLISEIIEARLAEILEFVNNELRLLGKAGHLAGGAVLAGGGAKLPGLTELARQELRMTTQIGLSTSEEWERHPDQFSEIFEDPEFLNALGLVHWGAEREGWGPEGNGSLFKKLFEYIAP